MNYANASFDAGFGRDPSAALASALEKRSRRDVCACVPYSLPCELRTDEITNCARSPERAPHLTTQAQQRRPRGVAIGTGARGRRSLHMVRRPLAARVDMP
jgi:hypothetical protein